MKNPDKTLGVRLAGAALVAPLALVGLALPASAAPGDITAQITSLKVEAEHTSGYDRDLFGDYDRKALLAENLADWPNCDGYYSYADNKCYADAGEVDVDHMVALKEAWDSGAHAWTPATLDTFAGDTMNLWLMTDNLNSSKGERDFAEWNPPYNAADCFYLKAYVAVKVEYDLSVDAAEKADLLTQAAICAPNPDPDPSPSVTPSASVSPSASASPSQSVSTSAAAPVPSQSTSTSAAELPLTGAPAKIGFVVGAALVLVGGAAILVGRRRRANFEA